MLKKNNIFNEIIIFFKSFTTGILLILNEFWMIFNFFLRGLKVIIIYIPSAIFNFGGSAVFKSINKIKDTTELADKTIKSSPSKISIFFEEKYNNLPFVKKHMEKMYSNLKVLEINEHTDTERSETKHTYKYLVKNKEGKLIKGFFNAFSKIDTYSYLLDEGYEIYEIETNPFIDFVYGDSTILSMKMRQKDLIFWLTQLSTYIKSGIPLTESVKILAQQNKKKKYNKIFDSIVYELTMGESFSEALKKQNNFFPGLLVNMVRAAEMIGDIEGTLDNMAKYYSDLEDTKKSIISALTYPAIIFVFSLIVVTFIMIFIIPQFVEVYTASNIKLNPLTTTIINLSKFIQVNYFFIFLFIFGVSITLYITFKNIKAFRRSIQFGLMHLPVIGKLIIYKEMNLFAKTFAALNKNNILLTDTIEILSKITNNEIYKEIMFNTTSNLLKGDRMSESFKNNWAIPELAYYMITTGESTGELSNMLEKVADYYQKEQKSIAGTLKSFIEPVMIALLAVIVGVIILAILIPMFGLYTAIQ